MDCATGSWDGKRNYKWGEHTFTKLNFSVNFTAIEWKKFVSYDALSRPFFLPYDYASVFANQWIEKSQTCSVIGIKRCKFLSKNNLLQVFAYCAEGNQVPCKLFLLKHYLHSTECNLKDGSKLFEVWESSNNTLHSSTRNRTFQLRGPNRNCAKKESLKFAPREYEDNIIISTNTDKIICDKPNWPIPAQTIYNLRREAKAEDYLANNMIEALHSMWIVEKSLPPSPKKGKSEYQLLQHISVCPFEVTLFSRAQFSILHNEYSTFVPTNDSPYFMLHLDGTGGILAKPFGQRNMQKDNLKQRMLFSLVRPVNIPGDNRRPTIFPFATYITNERSSTSLRRFLWSIKTSFESSFNYFPPFDGIVVDNDWAEINAILREFNNNMDVSEYLDTTYGITARNQPKEKRLVIIQLCTVHLFKHIHRETEAHFENKEMRAIVNVIFVHIVHSRTYSEFLNIFQNMIDIILGDEHTKLASLRKLVLFEHSKKIFHAALESDDHKRNESDATTDDAIYKRSPFYIDCMEILNAATKKWDISGKAQEVAFLNHTVRQYFAFLPLISAILVPKSSSNDDIDVQIRYSNAYAESYFSMLKETLRRMSHRIGKFPLRIDVLTRILKATILAFVLRYKNCLIRGTKKRRHDEQMDLEKVIDQTMEEILNPESNVPKTTDPKQEKNRREYISTPQIKCVEKTPGSVTQHDIDGAVSKWKRAAEAETPPNSRGLGNAKRAKSLFNRKLEYITNVVCRIHVADRVLFIPIQQGSSSSLCRSEAIVSPNKKCGTLLNGFYTNSTFYKRGAAYPRKPLGFISVQGYVQSVAIEELTCLDPNTMLSNFCVEILALLMIQKKQSTTIKFINFFDSPSLFGSESCSNEFAKSRLAKIFVNRTCYLWVVPVLLDSHFFLIVIDHNEKTFRYYDSLKSQERLRKATESFFNAMHVAGVAESTDFAEWRIIEEQVPQQSDGINCGVFVLKFIESLLTGDSMENFDPKSYRISLETFLLDNLLPIRDICSICGLREELDIINCEYCGRMLHSTCARNNEEIGNGSDSISNYKCWLCSLNGMSIKWFENK